MTPAEQTEAADRLIFSLNNAPESWTPDRPTDTRYITHAASRVKLWVMLGGIYVWEPHQFKFSWGNTRRLRAAYSNWSKRRGAKLKEEALGSLFRQIMTIPGRLD